ncbi:MAG: hypothetical protein LCH30_06520 [Proteobacteria bacterium]|nr:hypothetical protein [Pseudomonadota bacterium]
MPKKTKPKSATALKPGSLISSDEAIIFFIESRLTNTPLSCGAHESIQRLFQQQDNQEQLALLSYLSQSFQSLNTYVVQKKLKAAGDKCIDIAEMLSKSGLAYEKYEEQLLKWSSQYFRAHQLMTALFSHLEPLRNHPAINQHSELSGIIDRIFKSFNPSQHQSYKLLGDYCTELAMILSRIGSDFSQYEEIFIKISVDCHKQYLQTKLITRISLDQLFGDPPAITSSKPKKISLDELFGEQDNTPSTFSI